MTPEPTHYRPECGSHLGMLTHEIHGEPPCGQCRHGEAVRRLQAELLSPVPEAVWRVPVTASQAAEHRAQLAAALGVKDRDDAWTGNDDLPGESADRRETRRRRATVGARA
ncbi:hypothetical protein GCM10023191_101740 [Actinoallomurus oryzae]|uniref:Regulatory protein FmdB Zinc ribbon domain-containing protein n=1 Tax=Actinoallomurus oryzae TaxID=502180 RepID=A0ABP8RA89_9ACTN